MSSSLDDILNSALDDFDEPEDNDDASSHEQENDQEEKALLRSGEDNQMRSLHENMNDFLQQAQDPAFQSVLEQAFRDISNEDDSGKDLQHLLGSLSVPLDTKKEEASPKNAQHQSEVNIGVAKTLEGMAAASADMEGVEASRAEALGEDMMADMMSEFEKLGEKKDFAGIVDGMMTQLLSKDVMYDPMKQICEKYPEWLAEKETLLSKEEYTRYGKQYQFFQQIVAVYETEPDNYTRLTELMQDMQECGQPPSEIVQELAPGLKFDQDGMPLMPNMGPGVMPQGHHLPGQDQCLIS